MKPLSDKYINYYTAAVLLLMAVTDMVLGFSATAHICTTAIAVVAGLGYIAFFYHAWSHGCNKRLLLLSLLGIALMLSYVWAKYRFLAYY